MLNITHLCRQFSRICSVRNAWIKQEYCVINFSHSCSQLGPHIDLLSDDVTPSASSRCSQLVHNCLVSLDASGVFGKRKAVEPSCVLTKPVHHANAIGASKIMKHKKKKSHKHKSSSPHREKSHAQKRVKRLSRKSKSHGKSNLCASKMASYTPGTSSDHDEIVVLFDTRESRQGNSEPDSIVNLEEIPLPPNSPHHKKNSIEIIDLESIPLPPSVSNKEVMVCTRVSPVEANIAPDLKQKSTVDQARGPGKSEFFSFEREMRQNKSKEFRQWEHLNRDEPAPQQVGRLSYSDKGSERFTVMSYNVLAQELLEGHQYLYRNHDHRALSWEHRSASLLKEIQDFNADVLCFQEVQKSHLDSFYSQLYNFGYEGLFKQRTNGKVDGCAIYFKKNKFRLMENTSVEYFQYYEKELSFLDRDNVGIIARLQLKDASEDHQIVVANTHLLYNPRRHDIKLAQTQMLLTELERVSYIGFDSVQGKPKYWPVLLMGDFNLQPETAVYQFLRKGYLRYSDLASRSLTPLMYGQEPQKELLPSILEISNSCQHVGLLEQRATLQNNAIRSPHAELSLLKTYNSDYFRSFQEFLRKTKRKSCSDKLPSRSQDVRNHLQYFKRNDPSKTKSQNYGVLSHNFNFLSVYAHQRPAPNGKGTVREATTNQNAWVTVDYIFYSGAWDEQERSVVEAQLKLLSRYSLPTQEQCLRLKSLPNLSCGSDHLPLVASFLLTANKK